MIEHKIAQEQAESHASAHDEPRTEATGALEALRQRRMQRLDDDGEIKPGALLAAKQQSDAMPQLDVPRD